MNLPHRFIVQPPGKASRISLMPSSISSIPFPVKCPQRLHKNICPALHRDEMRKAQKQFQTHLDLEEDSPRVSLCCTLHLAFRGHHDAKTSICDGYPGNVGRCRNELTDFRWQDLTQHIFFPKCSRVSCSGPGAGRSAHCWGASAR